MTKTQSYLPAFTPGPYRLSLTADGVDDYLEIRTELDDQYVASVFFWDDHPEWTAKARANAALLVEAPRMFHALQSLLKHISRMPKHRQTRAFQRLQAEAAEIVHAAEGRAGA
jgi:hypothetical protein